MPSIKSVDVTDIIAAAKRLAGQAIRTPLLKSDFLNEKTGARVFIKPETLQVTGSFKFRGAYNAISCLSESQRNCGVVAASSGNHAQGIAEAARRLGVTARIVMPSDAPVIKIARTKRSGAEVILYNRLSDDRDAICREIAAKYNCAFIHPYDNADVIAGQGTAGLEICEDLHQLGETPDRVFVCTGGGGFTAGIALIVKDRFPQALIHTCEPEHFDDYARSLTAGERLTNKTQGGSICDAIVTSPPGEISFSILRNIAAEGQVMSDRQAMDAVAFAFNELKLVVEPGGAIALAALLASGRRHADETIVITLSGGNIDAEVLAACLR